MAFPAAAIRNAIAEVMEGKIGTTRTVDAEVFLRGVFDGQGDFAAKAKAQQKSDARHRFDVQLGPMRPHGASPVSANASNRLVIVPIRIDITTATATKVQFTDRDTTLADIASDSDDAIQALHFRGNLLTDHAGTATNIASGMLLGDGGDGSPQWEITQQDWQRNLVRSRISGAVIVSITQAT